MRIAIASVLLAACASSDSSPPSGDPPTLQVDTPTRGTTVDGMTVMVSGHVSGGAGAVAVTINGASAALNGDGAFSAQVPLMPGVDIVETHAIDMAANDVRDVRAVLAGNLEASDGTHSAPLATYASQAALAKISNDISAEASGVDFNGIAQSLNPVYDNGGCLGATVNITDVSLSGVDVQLDPQAGALAANVTINNVAVQLHAHFDVACIGGSGDITVSASAAHVNGALAVTVDNGQISTSLPNVDIALDNFNLSVSGIPGAITNLIEGTVQSKVQAALASAIQNAVPGIANNALNGLLAKPLHENLLGRNVTLSVTPSEATITDTGVFLAVDMNVDVAGGEGGMYLSQPPGSAESLMSGTSGLGIAVANDAINQLLAGLWAAGAFEQNIPVSSIPAVSAFLDPNGTRLLVKTSLPPTIATDANGQLQFALGDAVVSVQDDAGTELQSFALSVQTDVSMAQSQTGGIALTLGTPKVYAQVLVQPTDGSTLLSSDQVEGIVGGAWGLVSSQASDALGKLPMPSIAGVQLGAPTVTSVGNYVIADVSIQ